MPAPGFTAWAAGGDVLGGQGGVQFPERSLVPGEGVGAVDGLRDRRRRDGGSVAVPDPRFGRRPLKQLAERGHGVLGAGEAGLQAVQVGGDQPTALPGIRG